MKQKRYISYVGDNDVVSADVPVRDVPACEEHEDTCAPLTEEHVGTICPPLFSNPNRTVLVSGVDVTNWTMSVQVDNEFANYAPSFWSSRIRIEIIGDNTILREVQKWKGAGTVSIRVDEIDYTGRLNSYSVNDVPGMFRT